ncbi:hypothetical protein [Brachyspira sp. G79]|uniref:hypothetical protein n=1 Tax=Brachyspira sp. G79 TaxID=1358104 RepID=UPI001F0ABB17|nr:hypothetical protein [Brachyspira sp. G79]
MPYCNNCKLEIKTNKCPLCLRELNDNKYDKKIVYEEYPSYEWFYKVQKKVNIKR